MHSNALLPGQLTTFGCVPAAVSFFTSRQQGFGCSKGLIQTVVLRPNSLEMESSTSSPPSRRPHSSLDRLFFLGGGAPQDRRFAAPQCCHRNTVCISQWAIPGLLAFSWNSNSQIELAGRSGKVIASLCAGLLEDVYGDVSVYWKLCAQPGEILGSFLNPKVLGHNRPRILSVFCVVFTCHSH